MDSYKRFSDENYKHWLEAAESLFILRTHIRDFVETETENYHKCLREKLSNNICKLKCTFPKIPARHKEVPICENCEQWKKEILANHNNKGNVFWNNCQPHLWPTDKWEVAKVYMIRGTKDHHSFDQFDISAILNFMSHCKHFQPFKAGPYLNKVIQVRNKVMHSPDFRLSKDEMEDSIKKVQQLAEILEKHSPGLKTIAKNIQQFSSILEKCSRHDSKSTTESKESIKLLDREQHALKEKIEFLAQRYEEDQGTERKFHVELEGMKNFLDQNKDLLKNLGPQVNRLNEIQEKVNKHDQDINKLSNRVEQLENIAPDPVFSGEILKFKNHVLEEALRRNMPEPKFSEECKANGYTGIVNVNGCTFRGSQVCISKKNAHQEVARIALEYMNSHPEWKEESNETTSSSTTSSSSSIYYGTVTVVLNNQEVVSDGCLQEEDAVKSAYRKLACQFGLTSLEAGKITVLEYFHRCNFPKPQEHFLDEDNKVFCKLQLSGSFTFSDKDGSLKKKQAEQQAAKVAVQHLSGLFNCKSLPVAGDNWIGFLKERLEALGLPKPEYGFTLNREGITEEPEGPTRSEDNLPLSTTGVITKNDSLQPKSFITAAEDFPKEHTLSANECQVTETRDSVPPVTLIQAPKLDSSGTVYYGIVTVVLNNQEIVSDGCVQQEEAVESAYRKLAIQFGLTCLESKSVVLKHFDRCKFPTPQEHLFHKDDQFFCKLELSGPFTFYDKDGSSKKKQAEQQAAKTALQHLSGFFNCSFEAEAGKNNKGFLKERLDALHLENPVYRFKVKGGSDEDVEGPSTSGAICKTICLQTEESVSQECLVPETQAGRPSDIPNKSPMSDYAPMVCFTAISKLLELFHLKPPSVTLESDSTEMLFSCHVEISLDKFTFQNNTIYNNKKDAIRKTYLLLGIALGISILDESKASMLVKESFAKKSVTYPKEVFEDNKCSLIDITYTFVCDGKGSTEAEAKQDALQKAMEILTLLFGFKSLPKCSTVDETEIQINNLLSTKGQKGLICSNKPTLYKRSVELLFKDYRMESKREKRKKDNCNHLSNCILGLLAVELEPNANSPRNCLDEWFIQKNLKQPEFGNTEEPHGSKVTFSVNVSCSNPNWEVRVENAEEKLVDELRKRLNYIIA